ncbi:MAG: hypothetical protein J2P53_04725, partial [Bradyrhizobiaceae bacterium]|nr:hypothetical protein [Bradyrhizobiaceae bacterium]
MTERIVAPPRALRRSPRAALFFGGIGIATGAFIAGHFPHGRLLDGAATTLAASEGAPQAGQASGFAGLARAVRPAVIAIIARATETDPAAKAHSGMPDQRSRLVTSQGSGFFISADGYAVTSNHVIKGSISIEV